VKNKVTVPVGRSSIGDLLTLNAEILRCDQHDNAERMCDTLH